MGPFESLMKPTGLFSEKCIFTRKVDMVRFIEVNKLSRSLRGHKLLCFPHSLLNKKPNFSWRLVKIMLQFFFPSMLTDPLKSINSSQRVLWTPG